MVKVRRYFRGVVCLNEKQRNSDMSDFCPGQIVDDRYLLIELLGEGGMGTVFKAREIDLERLVAIKFLHPALTGQTDWSRFEREAKVLSLLSHPNIVAFFRFGVANSHPYIAMEYLEGLSLRSTLEKQSLTAEQCIEIAIQICDAIAGAHELGILHRDLKPENVVVDNNREILQVRIVDFGLASMISDCHAKQHLTQTGVLVGSLPYMSPEQCLGTKADARSDVYSVGCVLYELIAGRAPFESESPIGLIHKHSCETAPGFSKIRRNISVPAGLESVVFKALAKDPASRYQTMTEFQNDLKLVFEGNGGLVHSIKPSNKRFGRLTVQVAATALICSLSVVAWLIYWRGGLSGCPLLPKQEKTFDESFRRHSLEGTLRQVCDINAENHDDKLVQRKIYEQSMALLDGVINRLRVRKPPDILTFEAYVLRADLQLKQIMRAQEALPQEKELCEQYEDGAEKDLLRAITYATGGEGAFQLATGAYFRLGSVYQSRGDVSRAEQSYLKALSVYRADRQPANSQRGIVLEGLHTDEDLYIRGKILRFALLRQDRLAKAKTKELLREWVERHHGASRGWMDLTMDLVDLCTFQNNLEERDALLVDVDRVVNKYPLQSERGKSDYLLALSQKEGLIGHLDAAIKHMREAIVCHEKASINDTSARQLRNGLDELLLLAEKDSDSHRKEEIRQLITLLSGRPRSP